MTKVFIKFGDTNLDIHYSPTPFKASLTNGQPHKVARDAATIHFPEGGHLIWQELNCIWYWKIYVLM